MLTNGKHEKAFNLSEKNGLGLNGFVDEDTENRPKAIVKPLKTTNILSKNDLFDTLHNKAKDVSNLKKLSVKILCLKYPGCTYWIKGFLDIKHFLLNKSL